MTFSFASPTSISTTLLHFPTNKFFRYPPTYTTDLASDRAVIDILSSTLLPTILPATPTTTMLPSCCKTLPENAH